MLLRTSILALSTLHLAACNGAAAPAPSVVADPAVSIRGDASAQSAYKIYVANFGSNSVTTYKADGRQTTPTITSGLSSPWGVVVDANGKIYISNNTSNSV